MRSNSSIDKQEFERRLEEERSRSEESERKHQEEAENAASDYASKVSVI